MKKTTLMAIAIAIAAVGGYFVGQKQTHQPDAASQPSERKVLYWYDPWCPVSASISRVNPPLWIWIWSHATPMKRRRRQAWPSALNSSKTWG